MMAVLDTGHHFPLGRPVARELVSDHDTGRPTLPLQQLAQQALCGLLVAPALDQNVEHHPGLVHGTPEPVFHPGDLDDDLIKMPLVSGAGQPSPDPVGELLAELERLLPNGLMADHDAACRHHLLNHTQAEREAEIEPDRLADHLGRKPVTGIGRLGGWWAHSGRLPDRGRPAKSHST